MLDDIDAQIEVRSEPAHDGELLVVLLAEQGHVRASCSQQLGDHGGDAVEVPRPCSALHRVGQARDPHRGCEPVRIHRRGGRDEDGVDSFGIAGEQVVVEWPWIVIEVATFAELERIHEDRHDDGVGEFSGGSNQLEVTAMQRSHRRDQRNRSAARPGGI